MASAVDVQVRTLIRAANQMSAQRQTEEAERLFRQAEAKAPRHPLVLNQLALRRLASRDASGALTLLQEAIDAEPGDELWFNLAIALRSLGRTADALAAIESGLALNPNHALGLLEKGALQEELGRTRLAAMSYRRALQLLPPGFRAPQEMEAALQRARRATEANNRALESFIETRIGDLRRRFQNLPLNRFDQCVNIILQKRPIPRQQPSFMYFPELPTIEFYPREEFPELLELEHAADEIRLELLSVLADGPDTLDPYVVIPQGEPTAQWGELANSRRWSAYYFWNEGEEFPGHITRCPRTVEALRAWPLWDVPENGPTAMFSVLEPRTRIPAHTGTSNTRLVVHLPLVIPPDCGFRVGGQQRPWIPGQAFVFDDSIDHEAWNNSDQPRAMLIFTIWSPYVSEAEREFVRALTTSVGDFYGAARKSSGGHGA